MESGPNHPIPIIPFYRGGKDAAVAAGPYDLPTRWADLHPVAPSHPACDPGRNAAGGQGQGWEERRRTYGITVELCGKKT